MNPNIDLVLHVLAFVCFTLAAGRAWERYSLVAVGLALWMLSLIV